VELCCLEGLAIFVSKASVFCPELNLSCGYDDLAYVMLCWCCGGGVSSILAFHQEALPTLRYFPKDTELALGMTLLKLHWILQVFCVRQEDEGGVNWSS